MNCNSHILPPVESAHSASLRLRFTVNSTGQFQTKWADRISLDGAGALIIHGLTDTLEKVRLKDVRDLHIERVRPSIS
jgi:hypothetical protein